MSGKGYLGEFEQMVLLAILQRGEEAFALEVRRELEGSADRTVSRGAFYTTLDRLEQKGYVRWSKAMPENGRGGAMRRFEVTEAGLEALRASRAALQNLWRGLEDMLEGA
ncbi:MAG: helix-turn-helix transcriptional regulator [Gemmatimonadota bacterium]|jgi:PadR family transcriptional regulator, regulatory protein PadR